MKVLSLIIILFLCSIGQSLMGQNFYLIVFKDKANSPYQITQPQQFLSSRSIARRQKQGIAVTPAEFPPNPSYLNGVRGTGAVVRYTSRWLNAALIEANPTILTQVLALPYVKGNYSQGDIRSTTDNATLGFEPAEAPLPYGFSASQNSIIGADKMHQAGYHGEGMWIGLLDSGFFNAQKHRNLRHVYQENRILGTYDFVANEVNVYDDHTHGLNVFSTMAGYTPDTLIGTAYKASYLLLRTEDISGETKIEEANWLFAAEYADSVGVDIISSSLGYTEFQSTNQSYTYADMNGQKALSTKAADWAARAGILVVVSAGNQGASTWKYISAPADGDSVLAVGAVTPTRVKASFSSFGPSADGRIKPNLAAQGTMVVVATGTGFNFSSGTSFSAPLLSGMAAGFWQANPQLTAMQVMKLLEQSGSQTTTPDDQLGYGIPNFERAMQQVVPCNSSTPPSCQFIEIKILNK